VSEPHQPAWLRASACGVCTHLRLVRSAKGSVFALCGRAASDPRFPRYPPQPVASCLGYEPRDAADPPAEAHGTQPEPQ
jgi:hypothetical protein